MTAILTNAFSFLGLGLLWLLVGFFITGCYNSYLCQISYDLFSRTSKRGTLLAIGLWPGLVLAVIAVLGLNTFILAAGYIVVETGQPVRNFFRFWAAWVQGQVE